MSASERSQRGVVDGQGNILLRDHTLRRKSWVDRGLGTWNSFEWEATMHDAAGAGAGSVSDLGSHSHDTVEP